MAYYVVRIQTPDFQTQALVFVLDRNQNLMEQVEARIGTNFLVLSVNLLGVDWP